MEFIEGVTLLNTIETSYEDGFVIIFAAIVIMCISFIFGMVLSVQSEDWSYLFFSFLGGFMLTVVGVAIIAPFAQIPQERYQVSVNNSVGFNEFNQRYKIIEQEGNIYTIEIKELENEKN